MYCKSYLLYCKLYLMYCKSYLLYCKSYLLYCKSYLLYCKSYLLYCKCRSIICRFSFQVYRVQKKTPEIIKPNLKSKLAAEPLIFLDTNQFLDQANIYILSRYSVEEIKKKTLFNFFIFSSKSSHDRGFVFFC